jgi:hypothetical protein
MTKTVPGKDNRNQMLLFRPAVQNYLSGLAFCGIPAMSEYFMYLIILLFYTSIFYGSEMHAKRYGITPTPSRGCLPDQITRDYVILNRRAQEPKQHCKLSLILEWVATPSMTSIDCASVYTG